MKKIIILLIILFGISSACAQKPARHSNGVVIGSFASDPTGEKEGQLYWNDVSKTFRQYNGTIWEDLSATSGTAGIPSWAQYADTQYTTGSRFSITGGALAVTLPNNALNNITTYMPPGVDFYDGSTVTPATVGEVYMLRINYKAESATADNYMNISIDIGNGSEVVVLEKILTFPKGISIEHSFSSSNLIYALGTFIANGGTIKIYADDNTDVWDINYVISRVSVGDLDLPDAPSDGQSYVRKDGSWELSPAGGSESTSVSDTATVDLTLTGSDITADVIQSALSITESQISDLGTYLTTEVDGSITNELQTIANTSDATTHTATLSDTGGSIQLAEGSNITLTTTGTGADGIVTIASVGGGTDDQTAIEVPITDAGAIITATEVENALQENRTAINLNTAKVTNTDAQGLTWVDGTNTIEISGGTNAVITGFLETEVDGSTTNELNTSMSMVAGTVGVVDSGGTKSISLISTDGGNTINAGADGKLYSAAGAGESTTVSDTAEVDLTLTGSDITANIVTGSLDVLKLDSGVQTSLGLADTALQSYTVTEGDVTAHEAALTITESQISDLTHTSAPAYGLTTQIPYMNATNNGFIYDPDLTFNGSQFIVYGANSTYAQFSQGQLTLQGTSGLRSFLLAPSNSYIRYASGFNFDLTFPTDVATSNKTVTFKDESGTVALLSDIGGGGASQLSELSDVNTSTPTNRNVLVADGVDFESRALVEADISDLGTYLTTEVDGSVSNEGSLTVGAGTGSTSIINSNTSGSTGVTLTAGTNISISESGNVITLTAIGDGTGTDSQNLSWVDGTNTMEISGGTNAVITGFEPTKGADDNFVTDAEKIVIGNTSGTNSGDNSVNTLYSGLVSNATHTGDVTGSTDLTIATDAVDLSMLSATGIASSSTYLRGDNTWATVAGGGIGGTISNDQIPFGASIANEIEGSTKFTWNDATSSLGLGLNGSFIADINFGGGAGIMQYDDNTGTFIFNDKITATNTNITGGQFIDSNGTASTTGTVLDLSDNITGKIYNEATPSTATAFTTSNLKTGGFAVTYISSATEPTVDGSSTVSGGSVFQGGATQKLVVYSPDGVAKEHFFVSLAVPVEIAPGGEATTVSDTAEVDLVLAGVDITATIVASSLDETKLDASVNASLDLADTSAQAGSISSTEVAFGNAVAGTIDGSSGFTYAGSTLGLQGSGGVTQITQGSIYVAPQISGTATLEGGNLSGTFRTILDFGAPVADHTITIPNKSGEMLVPTISGIGIGEILKYSGAGWVNNTLAEAGILTSEVDGSISNEGSLTVAAGGATTSVINSNTSGSTGVTLQAGTNMTISESGNTITLNATTQGSAVYSKTITVMEPLATDDISFFFTNDAITITEIRSIVRGTTPTAGWILRHGLDRSAVGSRVNNTIVNTSNQATGTDTVAFDDATIIDDSFVWLEITQITNTVDELSVTVFYTIDPPL